MNKNSYVGIVTKIRVIKSFPNMLVRFTLRTNTANINCLVHNKDFANLILFLDEDKFELATFGHCNNRNQFIIEKFTIRNPDSFIREFVLKPLSKTA